MGQSNAFKCTTVVIIRQHRFNSRERDLRDDTAGVLHPPPSPQNFKISTKKKKRRREEERKGYISTLGKSRRVHTLRLRLLQPNLGALLQRRASHTLPTASNRQLRPAWSRYCALAGEQKVPCSWHQLAQSCDLLKSNASHQNCARQHVLKCKRVCILSRRQGSATVYTGGRWQQQHIIEDLGTGRPRHRPRVSSRKRRKRKRRREEEEERKKKKGKSVRKL